MAQERDDNALFERIRFRGEPVAHPDSIILQGDVRFTVLTPRLLRMEWSATGEFEDRGTFAFPTRRGATPPFDSCVRDGVLTVDTGPLTLRHVLARGRFGPDNLSVVVGFGGERVEWRPGAEDPLNLRGTRRTVDGCAGDASLGPGILSRVGWAVHDDSRAVVFNIEDGWVAPRPDHGLQDWYFFGYGHDYKGALQDYLRFGGDVPLIPRYVLGLWWSRYWAYSDRDLRELVGEFGAHGVPLDVLVVDMDWHLPDSWTGYTWDRRLFPDPEGFLDWVHQKGLRATLNLHPAQGVQPHEDMYEAFAAAVGADPRGGKPIPFRITDKRFVAAYFRLLHHPMEESGVDFWWVDWQQGEACEMEGLDPLPWLNHLHFTDSTRRGRRAMLYSRWGGLGNHRYPIGFSGDAYVVWSALQFQPYLTATAANVAYGWWSHDIGGHMGGATDPELYARWVQFGALSPCLRLHATKDPRAERRPWAYPEEANRAASSAIQLRYRLLLYTYTMARVAADTGVSLCRPMYYENPEADEAYAARYQYYFGDQMIAAPFVFPGEPSTGMAATDVWVPSGTWVDFSTQETFEGPRWVRLVGDLQRLPILVRAGAVLPLAAGFSPAAETDLSSGTSDALRRDALAIAALPGGRGEFRLYEDDGLTGRYRTDECEWTAISNEMRGADEMEMRVAPVEGHCEALPRDRSYEVRFIGVHRPDRVAVDGGRTGEWRYDAAARTATVSVPRRPKSVGLSVTIGATGGVSALGEAWNRELVARDVRRLLGRGWPGGPIDVDAVLACESPGREDAIARLGGPFVRFIEFVTPEEAARSLGRVIVGGPADDGDVYSVRAEFHLQAPEATLERVVEHRDVIEPSLLDVPFAFDGVAQPLRWAVTIELSWRGASWRVTHTSQPLFASVYAWRGLLADDCRRAGTSQHAERHVFVQDARTLDQSLLEPFVVDLAEAYGAPPAGEQPPAVWLQTTVQSPVACAAVLRFVSHGEPIILLNGDAIEEADLETPDTDPPPFFQYTRTTVPVALRQGANHLRVSPGYGIGHQGTIWRFGATFADPDGDLIGGLLCRP